MRYLAVPSREHHETEQLRESFGKRYEPEGAVSLGAATRLGSAGTESINLEGEALVIAPETASWAFLSADEGVAFQNLDGATFKEFSNRWTGLEGAEEEFVGQLFRRGLVKLDDRTSLDQTIFDDSPNVTEGNLVELLLTERCNLACGYCLAGTNPKMPRMTREIACRTIDLAFAMEGANSLAFEFSGGEPFLEFTLMRELVSYAQSHPARRERPIFFNVQTNCTLLDEERVSWLLDNEVRVGISLDGGPESHDVSRPLLGGGASSGRLRRGLDLLQTMGVAFGALVVLNRSNVASARALADFLLENDITSFKLNPIAYLGTARGSWDAFGLRQEEVVAYFQELLELITKEDYPLLEDNLRTMCEFLVSKQRATRCLRSHCGAGDTFQAVSAAGDIYPCGRATQSAGLKLGNVMQDDLITLSEPARRSPIILEIRDRRPRTLEGCVTCPYRQLCQAGCSAQAFERYGTVRHRTPECHFYKTMYPYLMRRLSFDLDAVETLNRAGYFDGRAVLMDREYGRAAAHACA
jgi:radical SAM protein with 4Fe4S-binding SPASM domain